MKKIIIPILLFISFSNIFSQNCYKTSSGIKTNVQGMDVEICFYSPNIVRVIKLPEGKKLEKQSLSVIKSAEKVELNFTEETDYVSISSSSITVKFNRQTGKISFSNNQFNLFTEKDYGAQFTPTLDVKTDSYIIRQSFLLNEDETIYGLGQQQNGKLNQRNNRIVLQQDNMKICIPFFQSIKGYGVFWDNYSPTTFTDNRQETSFESLGNNIDYYFMVGKNTDDVVAKMRDLTGQAPMMPLWSYGYFQSKERYKTQDEIVSVVQQYRNLGVPLDGIIQDWQYWGKDSLWNAMSFDKTTFPNPQTMVDKIHQLNAHLMIVAWPGFGPNTEQYKELSSKKMMINFDTWPPNSGTKPYDPYNPEARDIYWKYLNKGVFSLNTDGWWLDSSEPDHINVKDKDFDQPTHLGSYRSVINAFPLEHIKGVYEHQRATTSEKRVCILTRSAFAGQQRFASNSWSGDIVSSWETLRKQIPASLNFSLTGIPYWNADIGGFFLWNFGGGNALKDKTYQELYIRWVQFGAFTPMMRSHGTDAPREIYQFGKKGDWTYDAIEKYIHLRYQFLPYIYSTAWGVTSNSESIIRPLIADFSSDKKTLNLNDEYLFGKSILVAPVLEAMYTRKNDGKTYEDFSNIKYRKVYLPQGNDWYDFWTGEIINGGQTIEKKTPIDILPLFVKAGSILPVGPKVQYAEEKKWDKLEMRIYSGADGEFTLYEDENNNYNYEKGQYSTITFKWDDKNKMLTVSEIKGKFNGMIKNRVFNVVLVNDKNGLGDKFSVKFNKSINYTGKILKLKL